MRFYEALIIYFALGAPFAVLSFFRNRNKSGFETTILTAGALIFWLPSLIFLRLKSPSGQSATLNFDQSSSSDAEIWLRVREILRLARFGINFLEFRSALEHFTALTSAQIISDKIEAGLEMELLKIAGHGNEKLGVACLRRTNRSKLVIHKKRAMAQFLGVANEYIVKNNDLKEIRVKLIELCVFMGENETAKTLRLSDNYIDWPSTISSDAHPKPAPISVTGL